ncbi:MAG: hypothetical protein ACK6AD_09920 [Cyanobacteriota bacterium]|jgi:hypothetical protein
MKPRRLILHAGPHKTGTSSIQAVLRNQIFEAFYYPKTGQWHDGAHHNLIFSLVPELSRADAQLLEEAELLHQLELELADDRHDTLLISSEFLSLGCADRVVNWLVRHEIADPEGIRALVVERELLSRAASFYNQAVKDPYVGETRSPNHWLKEEADNLRLEPILETLQSAGASVEVLPYEPAQSLVTRALMAAGAHEEELPDQIPWTNTSMSEPVLMALLEVNRTVTDPEQRLEHQARLWKEFQPVFCPSTPNLFLHWEI